MGKLLWKTALSIETVQNAQRGVQCASVILVCRYSLLLQHTKLHLCNSTVTVYSEEENALGMTNHQLGWPS